jgi:hypothetical protein
MATGGGFEGKSSVVVLTIQQVQDWAELGKPRKARARWSVRDSSKGRSGVGQGRPGPWDVGPTSTAAPQCRGHSRGCRQAAVGHEGCPCAFPRRPPGGGN